MRDELVTIVIPIYNVEKYLERCIKSVINQTYENLEIILVDDGSPDRCPEICDEWSKRDKRILVIHKKNEGLGYARNTGIENATGEYIYFLDSDDYIALDAIEKALSCAVEMEADIVIFGYCNVKSNGDTWRYCVPHTSENVYTGCDVRNIYLPNLIAPDITTGETTNLWMSAWDSLYSMNLILKSGWKFVSEREVISEDIYSLLYLYKNVNKVAVIPEALYFYCENETSLTRTLKKDRFERIKFFYNACIKACDELGYSDKVQYQLTYPFLSNTIAMLKMVVAAEMGKDERKQLFRSIVEDETLQSVLRKISLKNEKITRRLLLLSIKKKLKGVCYVLLKAKS